MITGNTVSRRYATALFNLGREAGQGEMEKYGATLNDLCRTMEENPSLAEVFHNPILSSENKKSVVTALLADLQSDEQVRRFCQLLADKDRLDLVPAIAKDYTDLVYQARGIDRGVLTTAVELDAERKTAITKQLEKQTKRKLELAFVVDASILGGIVLKIGDMVLDASLRAQLENLRDAIKRGE